MKVTPEFYNAVPSKDMLLVRIMLKDSFCWIRASGSLMK